MSESSKENEWRLPIHPQHLDRIDEDLRGRIFLEHGYAERFGITDDVLLSQVGGLRTREELIAECDVVLLAKPLATDLKDLRDGQVLWGWPHCVQDEAMTQLAIDHKLTLIAFEAMNHWRRNGSFNLHVFHKNNELAGYCSVLQALELTGSTGNYGRRLRAVVIGFGSTARGAVTALNALGIHDVDILTNRDVAAVSSPIHSAQMLHFGQDDTDPSKGYVDTDDGEVPLAGFLAEHDIIVNCVLQDTAAPLTFLFNKDIPALAPNTLVIDVSCDEGMGFEWATPTTFEEPILLMGDDISYYAVDHSPSYLWNSATWEISEALLPYLRTVLDGPGGWSNDETIRRAIEIRDGAIQNLDILLFQDRAPDYPHARSQQVTAGR